MIPPEIAERSLNRFEFESRSDAGALHAFLGDLTAAEESRAHADAPHVQTFEFPGLQPFTDDNLGTSTADVDYQSASRFARHRVTHTEIDQTCFFDAGNDFDWMTERGACAIEKRPSSLGSPQRVGPHDAHALCLHVAQSLAETLETRERSVHGLTIESARLIETRRKPDHLAQAIDDRELAVRIARDDHVKTIGAQIDGGDDVGDFGSGHGYQAPGCRLLAVARIRIPTYSLGPTVYSLISGGE